MPTCPNLTTQDLQNAIERFNAAYVIYKNNPNTANKQNLLNAHTYLNTIINCYENNINPTNTYEEKTFQNLVNNYSEVVKKRKELDVKMQEVYNIQNSLPVENRLNMDSSVYATVLWSILATSVLFIIFVKL